MATSMFFADLKGHTYYDLFKKAISLDRSIDSFEERKKAVDEIINDNPYIIEYFSNYFDCHLTSIDNLSNENNICKIVEMLTNYLLMSKDGRELEKREKTYYIDSKHIDRKKDKPVDINTSKVMVVDFNKENYRLDKKQKITSSELKEDSYCGEVLRDYKQLIDTINNKLRSGQGNQIKLSKAKHTVNDDMLLAKDLIKGVYGYNIYSPETHNDDYYCTLSDPNMIKKLLKFNQDPRGLERSNTWIISLDFKELLKEIKFDAKEMAILALYRNEYTVREIEEVLEIPKSTCSFWINKIINKIANYNKLKHEKYIKEHLGGYNYGFTTTN